LVGRREASLVGRRSGLRGVDGEKEPHDRASGTARAPEALSEQAAGGTPLGEPGEDEGLVGLVVFLVLFFLFVLFFIVIVCSIIVKITT
jgi:hypothetical protein